MKRNYANVLIVTSVEAERAAILRGLACATTTAQFTVVAAGVGVAHAAAATAEALVTASYDLVVSAGIGGGFLPVAPVASVAIASSIVAGDFGAQTAEGHFIPIDELGFGSATIATDARCNEQLLEACQRLDLPATLGMIVTLSTVTGTAETAEQQQARWPHVVAEAMEGFGVATAAQRKQLPVIEIRAISNAVGPRNRDAWRIGDALQSLERAMTVLGEVV